MKKQIKQAISFLMAVCLLAGNSYVDIGASAVTMTDWVEVSEEDTTTEIQEKEPLLSARFKEYSNMAVRKVRAEEENGATTADGGRFVFFDPNETNKIIETGQTIQVANSITFFLTKVDKNDKPIGFGTNVEIMEVSSGKPEVAEVDWKKGEESTGYNVTITAVSPGLASVNVVVKDNNDVYTFTCNVEVKLTIDTSDATYWKSISNEKVLVFENKDSYAIKLKNVKNKNINGDLMAWSWKNDGVIEVDEATGIITPKGAGVTTVELKTVTGAMSEKITVIVAPTGSTTPDGTFGSIINIPEKPENGFFNESFTLYTNSTYASNMSWEIYAITYDGTKKKETKIAQKDTDLLTYEISKTNGELRFTGVKAGTYRVIGYSSNEKKYADQPWNKVEFNIVVGVNLKDTAVYMNVGDSYSILENCNISPSRFSELIGIEYVEEVVDSLYASLDANKGLVTSLNNGIAKFRVKYKTSSGDSIFAPEDTSNRDKEVIYTFHIIDAISLNTTNVSMYTGNTYQLVANVTDRTVPVTWKSTDESYVTVDSNGLITAKKATGTKVVKVIASQVIDGVEKMISCNVVIQPAVTSINLSKTEVILDMGEYEMIKATVKPDGIAGTKLIWKSSDTSIFDITDSTELTATILAKAGGTAVLTALNAENMVVAYCKVTVTQGATGIKLSATKLDVKLTDKTYQLYAELIPENTTNGKIIWASQNTALATVDAKGKVTFKGAGTVTISAQSEDNPTLIEYCIFNIKSDVSGVSLDDTEIEMYVGETRRLSYTVSPSNANNKNVTWTSLDTSVVAVDDTGLVTAKGAGKTQIMVMTEEGGFYAVCMVTVKQEATGVKMNYTQINLNVGEYFDMNVTITPANSTEASLTWETLNPDIATVSSTGRITGRASGTATIMVKTPSGATSFCTVTVIQPLLSLKLDTNEITIDIGETFILDPIFQPANPSNMEVEWESSNEDVVEIDKFGEITGVAGGTSVITCVSVDGGYRDYCLVTVIEPVVEITMSPDTYRLGFGKTYQLTATISNHGTATDTGIYWSSSDEDICTVDDKGRITGVGYGYATITAEAEDDSGAFATCEVRVVREVTSVKLNYTTLTLLQGESASLQTTIQPSNAAYTTAIFSSSDETVAIVDEDGVITALNPGSVVIRADARDNSGKYAVCYLTVIAPIVATGVTVSDKEVVLTPGEQKQVVISMKPSNSTDTKTWTSNNEMVATVNGQGVITAHTTGTATITVMTSSGKMATVAVTVLGLSRTTLELAVYTEYSRLVVDGAVGTVRWDVEDPTICEVNNGTITARKVGTTKVTATINGRTLTCTVKVVK